MNQIQIRHILHAGRNLPVKASANFESVKRDKICGGNILENSPISCPRCQGITMHLFQEMGGYSCFCATDECLKLDSDASKAIEREKYAEKMRELYKKLGINWDD